jgi:hypothetical protein
MIVYNITRNKREETRIKRQETRIKNKNQETRSKRAEPRDKTFITHKKSRIKFILLLLS